MQATVQLTALHSVSVAPAMKLKNFYLEHVPIIIFVITFSYILFYIILSFNSPFDKYWCCILFYFCFQNLWNEPRVRKPLRAMESWSQFNAGVFGMYIRNIQYQPIRHIQYPFWRYMNCFITILFQNKNILNICLNTQMSE